MMRMFLFSQYQKWHAILAKKQEFTVLLCRVSGFETLRLFSGPNISPANANSRIQVLQPRVWIGGQQKAVDGKAAWCYRRLVNRARVIMDTRPRPVLRAARQPRLHGIQVDILDLPVVLADRAQSAIKESGLPNRPRFVAAGVEAQGGAYLDRFHHR